MRNFLSGRECLVFAVLTSITVLAPAAQAQKVFSGIAPAQYSKKWAPNEWHIYALPDGACFAIAQEPAFTPFTFWGFRQRPGSRVDLFFGGIDDARPQTVQISYNDGRRLDYDARVVRQLDWDAYSVSIQANALSVLHDQTIIDAYVNGEKIFHGITNSMRNVEKAMQKCLEWQQSH